MWFLDNFWIGFCLGITGWIMWFVTVCFQEEEGFIAGLIVSTACFVASMFFMYQ